MRNFETVGVDVNVLENWVRALEIEVDESQLQPSEDGFVTVSNVCTASFEHEGPVWNVSARVLKGDDICHFGFAVKADTVLLRLAA